MILAGTRTRNARTRPNVHAQRQRLFLLQIITFCIASVAKTLQIVNKGGMIRSTMRGHPANLQSRDYKNKKKCIFLNSD